MTDLVTIPKTNGLYSATETGEIYSKKRATAKGGILKKVIVNGYYRVEICINGKRSPHFVHRLVATAFIPNPNNYPLINHKDGNRLNNNVSNLEWCTASQNITHRFDVLNHSSPNRKLTKRQVFRILENPNISNTPLSKKLSIPRYTIEMIRAGKTYKNHVREFQELLNQSK